MLKKQVEQVRNIYGRYTVCLGWCFPALPSLWLPQTKGPAMSASTEQAMKGSLSERHEEGKEEMYIRHHLYLITYRSCYFYENVPWRRWGVFACLHLLRWHFSEQNESRQRKINFWKWKRNKIQSHVVGLTGSLWKKNTNEAIWL